MTHSKPNSLPLSLFGFEARQHVFLQRRQQLLHHHVGHHLELTDTEISQVCLIIIQTRPE